MGDVVLGYDTLAGYVKGSPYFGALIGRYANRIAKGKFTLDGQTYTLFVNNGPNSLHGGKVGFDKKVWAATPMHMAHGVGLSLKLTSPDGEEGYPGNLASMSSTRSRMTTRSRSTTPPSPTKTRSST